MSYLNTLLNRSNNFGSSISDNRKQLLKTAITDSSGNAARHTGRTIYYGKSHHLKNHYRENDTGRFWIDDALDDDELVAAGIYPGSKQMVNKGKFSLYYDKDNDATYLVGVHDDRGRSFYTKDGGYTWQEHDNGRGLWPGFLTFDDVKSADLIKAYAKDNTDNPLIFNSLLLKDLKNMPNYVEYVSSTKAPVKKSVTATTPPKKDKTTIPIKPIPVAKMDSIAKSRRTAKKKNGGYIKINNHWTKINL